MDPSDTLAIVEHHLEITQLVTAIMVAEHEHLEQIHDPAIRRGILASYEVTMNGLQETLQYTRRAIAELQLEQKTTSST